MNPDQTSEEKKLDGLSYAVTQIRGHADEDRFYASLSEDESKRPSIHEVFARRRFCSFGIFDGHGGGDGSKVCEESLHSYVRRYLNLTERELNRIKRGSKRVSPTAMFDAIFSLSVRAAHKELDADIKMKTIAGSTALSLFIFEHPEGGFRAYCSWVGDSRCLACYYDKEKMCPVSMWMSEDHKPALPREARRIQDNIPVDIFDLPYEVDEDIFRVNDKSDAPELDQVRLSVEISLALNLLNFCDAKMLVHVTTTAHNQIYKRRCNISRKSMTHIYSFLFSLG